MKELKRDWLKRKYGTKRVFIVFAICCFITLISATASIILTFTSEEHTAEKLIEHLALCFMALVLSWIPILLRSKFSFNIPSFLQITVTVFIVAHFVLGEIYRFYDYLFYFDKTLHLLAGAVISVLGFSIVYGFSKNKSGSMVLSPFFVALFSFCFSLALLVLWEIFEFGMDFFFKLNMQRWQDGFNEELINGEPILVSFFAQGRGLVDTMTDLLVGILGAAFICILGGFFVKKYPDNTRFYITRSKSS